MKKPWHVLIVEDDSKQAKILQNYLTHKGYQVDTASTGSETLQKISANCDIIILDWKLPDTDGLTLLDQIREKRPLTQVIMLTAFGTVERAVEAIKRGAYHYLTKPVHLEELLITIDRAVRELRLQREVDLLRQKLETVTIPEFPDVIAESFKMKEVLALVHKVAQTDATVLILGESGTGKEVVSRLIHNLSNRRTKSFLTINCAAIPEGLLESELFGHEKGSFTGAERAKPGLFELAHEGTLFLDEIGDMPLSLQAKLLRVLQDGTFHRIGGTREITIDVRVIAATNRDLETMVKEGRFREDLYWRLNVFSVCLPPLRARKEDILALANYFLAKYSERHRKKVSHISRNVMERLLTYDFPGNVRELENAIERAVIMTDEETIRTDDLPPAMRDINHKAVLKDAYDDLPLPEAVALLERCRIVEALKKSDGIKTRAAELLGISERVLRYKLEKYGIDA